MMHSTTDKDVELVVARSVLADIRMEDEEPSPVGPSMDEEAQQGGLWTTSDVPVTRRPICRRRAVILSILGIALLMIVIAAVSRGGRSSSSSPVSATGASGATQEDPTTEPPPTTLKPTVTNQPSPYDCKGDRIDNGHVLRKGHFLCSGKNNRYRFGMDKTGFLIFADDDFNLTATLSNGTKGDYFKLARNASFAVHNSADDIVWEQKCDDNVTFSEECLTTHHGNYDCPYLHLHGGGALILNYIDDGGWQTKNALHVYEGFKDPKCPHDFFCSPTPETTPETTLETTPEP